MVNLTVFSNLAEKYIVSKIDKLSPKYLSYISKGSQTPSDIFSVARRNGYWHIMLTQVKSSSNRDAIYELNETEIKQFGVFAKFLKDEISASVFLEQYKTKPIVISMGYAGVLTAEVNGIIRHRTTKVKPYKIFRMNFGKIDVSSISETVNNSHDLGIKTKILKKK